MPSLFRRCLLFPPLLSPGGTLLLARLADARLASGMLLLRFELRAHGATFNLGTYPQIKSHT
jgi:hypothetical protein